MASRARYALLVCDLDGTLLPRGGDLDPALTEAFRRAGERGFPISIATGRMPPGVDRYRDALGLRAPLVFYNGALVREPDGGRELLSLPLPRGLLWPAYELFAPAPVHPLFYRDDRLYCLEQTYPVRAYCDEQGLTADTIPFPEDFLRRGAFMKCLLMGDPEALPLVRDALGPVVGEGARLVMTRRDYLEIVHRDVSKGRALLCLAEHLGVPLERVIAVGDEENDLEMFRVAGLGVAMPGAPASVRAAADRVAPPPAEGGLLALLREFLPGVLG
jgi:Cof subfamily protein (haloacid dehalogenase superfamily)